MSVTGAYRELFANKLAHIEAVEIPKVLESLPKKRREEIVNGNGTFPRTLVESIRDGDLEKGEKAHAIVVVTGLWMKASSGSRWSFGPIEGGWFGERIGIGVESADGESFTPLLGFVEEIIEQGKEETRSLDILQGLAEFAKRKTAQASSAQP